MATYKVIQDIEAEDKLFGPLTLKQFIFACLAILFGYLGFWSLINELWILVVFFALPTIFFAILAFPYSKDQPTEVWLIAKLRFFFRPRKRIWDQDGIKEFVTITVPKQEEKHYTDGLSNAEVKSRLRALADTIDSRGWAVKGSAINLGLPQQTTTYSESSDRLYQPSAIVQEGIAPDIRAGDDIYDQSSSPTAQHFVQMIQASEKKHREQVVSRLSQQDEVQQNSQESTEPQNDYWFMRQSAPPTQPGVAKFGATPIVVPGQKPSQLSESSGISKEEEQKILEKIHENKNRPNPMNSHLKTIKPLSEQDTSSEASSQNHKTKNASSSNKQFAKQKQKDSIATQTTDKSTGKQSANADILNLANNNDLSVETIARQFNKNKVDDQGDNEVVVSLH